MMAWEEYLDQLETSLRDLHKGGLRAVFPGPDDLGPLPDELRPRAESLLGAVNLLESDIRTRRSMVTARLAASTKQTSTSRVIRA